MKRIVVIYYSHHHNNTKKLLEACKNEVEMTLCPIENVNQMNLDEYEVVGFASGIYKGDINQRILQYIETNEKNLSGKEVFVFTTSGSGTTKPIVKLSKQLESFGSNVVGIFSCKGYDTYGPFKLIGGISKKHPTQKDCENAVSIIKQFA